MVSILIVFVELYYSNYGSLGIFPGLFDKSHGLLCQNSSLITSTCCTVILAFALLFLSFSSWVFESSFCSIVFAESSSTVSGTPGSTNSYYTHVNFLLKNLRMKKATYISENHASLFVDLRLVIIIDPKSWEQNLILVRSQWSLNHMSIMIKNKSGELHNLQQVPSPRPWHLILLSEWGSKM